MSGLVFLCCDPFVISAKSYKLTCTVLCLYNTTFGVHKNGRRGSYMSTHVLLNLLNKSSKRDKMLGKPPILSLLLDLFNKLATTLNNSIIQEHECKILFII